MPESIKLLLNSFLVFSHINFLKIQEMTIMKKFVVLLIMIAGSFFVGCFGGDDEFSSAQLKYTNSQTDTTTVEDIKWVANGTTNQTWSGTLSNGSSTAYQTITEDTGQSECLGDGGTTYQLEYTDGNGTTQQTLTVSDGSSNTWDITSATAKK